MNRIFYGPGQTGFGPWIPDHMDIILYNLYNMYIILKLMTKILKGWAAAGFVPNAILHMVKSRFKQDIICDISDHMHHVQILTAIW